MRAFELAMTEKYDDAEVISPPAIELDNSSKRAKVFAALPDSTRVQIMQLLADSGELSGTSIAN